MGKYLDELTPEQLDKVNSLMEIPDSKIKPDYRREDMTDWDIGQWKVLKYAGKKKWICICSCGEIKSIKGTELKAFNSLSCGHERKQTSLIGQTFGYWEVIEKVDGKHHRCRCHCGCPGMTEKIVSTYDLKNGKTKSCGYNTTRKESIIGKKFNHWTVLEYIGEGKYKCECDCVNKAIGIVKRADLISGQSKSCGHSANKLVDITNQKFGEWTAIEHVGYGRWLCKCSCEAGTERILRHTELLNGDTKSCGCKRKEQLKSTMISRYGETCSARLGNPRTPEQIAYVSSRESLLYVIKQRFNYKPTIYELEDVLNLKYTRIIKIIHEFNLEAAVTIYENSSRYELEIYKFIAGLVGESNTIRGNRTILNGKELDILIPSARFAIEFNGTYWHSDIFKDKTYHQDKTIDGFKHGIHIMHIFEHEWLDENKREIIQGLIRNKLSKDKRIIYARECTISNVDTKECTEFVNRNHIQGSTASDIKLGLYYNSELIGVMTFGEPRFNSGYEYELIRLAWKSGINVVGGAERLFKAFIRQYNPTSIISYCDISKFNGGVYIRLGFKTTLSDITSPNYVWVNPISNNVLTRYQTQKHKLLAKGLGSSDMTEAQIMEELGYLRIYDSGNARFTWVKEG